MVEIRPVDVGDRGAWEPLWDAYLVFYESELATAVTEATWDRLVAERSDIGGLVAVDDGVVVGFVHYVVHATTWDTRPAAYLEDLFVDPGRRGVGVGRALIEAMATLGRQEGWSQVHWITAADNEPARRIYRTIATETDWVRYELDLPPA